MTLQNQKPVLLFDGVCNLCNGIVQFVIKRDPKKKFLFTSLQSDAGQELLQQFGLRDLDLDSFVYVQHNQYYTKSTAALHVLKGLGRGWQLLYIFIMIPRPVRDKIYDWIAKNRYKWFGKKDQCMVPAPELKNRFLD